ERSAFAVLADARFATGDENDLLGSGETSIRGIGIVSARFGAFSPHGNVGYVFRSGNVQNDAVLATVGFDEALADWATLAVDFMSELQAGASKLRIPDPVTIEIPFRRTITPTNIRIPSGRTTRATRAVPSGAESWIWGTSFHDSPTITRACPSAPRNVQEGTPESSSHESTARMRPR